MPHNVATLRDALDATGLSQMALADALGVDGRTVRRWLAGDSEVPGPVVRLCRLLTNDPARLAELA